jgi:hypothetical protein
MGYEAGYSAARQCRHYSSPYFHELIRRGMKSRGLLLTYHPVRWTFSDYKNCVQEAACSTNNNAKENSRLFHPPWHCRLHFIGDELRGAPYRKRKTEQYLGHSAPMAVIPDIKRDTALALSRTASSMLSRLVWPCCYQYGVLPAYKNSRLSVKGSSSCYRFRSTVRSKYFVIYRKCRTSTAQKSVSMPECCTRDWHVPCRRTKYSS